MARFFSYTIPVDDGAAPNPFNGLCTLAICKPAIRRVASSLDWVAGLGSVNSPCGDLSGHLVYAMRVEQVLSMADYDDQAEERWPHRIPDMSSPDLCRRLGDCIYDFSKGAPRQRSGVHDEANIDTDLGGENVLISSDFYYFGSSAVELPEELSPICHQTQGHRSDSNEAHLAPFVLWLRGLGVSVGQHGWPAFHINWRSKEGKSARAVRHASC